MLEFEARTIQQGETPAWLAGHDLDGMGTMANLSSGYTCQFKVLGTSIDRAVTALTTDSKHFIPSLTKAESSAIPAGVYVFAVQIENTSLGFADLGHGALTVEASAFVSPYAVELPNRIDRLRAREDALEDALDEAIGGKETEVWNGRYGNKAKWSTMSYQQIEAALIRVRAQIADEERVASGASRRAPIGLVWAN